jgi:hypothetical protein
VSQKRLEEWRRRQEGAQHAATTMFDLKVRPEARVFESAMAHTGELFSNDDFLSRLAGVKSKVALVLLQLGYQLCMAAWEDLRAGRVAGAFDHLRSVSEAPDYMLAAALNEDFARAWLSRSEGRTVKVERAWRIIKAHLDSKEAGSGDKYVGNKREGMSRVQPMSHVSPLVAAPTFFRGWRGSISVPEGFFDEPGALRVANLLAESALQLLEAATIAFDQQVSKEWQRRVKRLVPQLRNALMAEFAKWGDRQDQ